MTLKRYSPVSAALITDTDLPHAAKHIAAAMIFAAKNNIVRGLKIRSLAKLCHCSHGTVQKHLALLEQKGYIQKRKCYRYSLSLGRYINDTNEYELTMPTEGGYALIPRSIFSRKVTSSCFTVMLYLYLCAGREGRAYPSVRHIAGCRKDGLGGCGVSKASVCRALAFLKKILFFIKAFCERRHGGLSCNSYWLTEMVSLKAGTVKATVTAPLGPPSPAEPSPAASCSRGWSQNWNTYSISKITGVSYLEGKNKGVFYLQHIVQTIQGIWQKFAGLKKRLWNKDTT